MKVAVYLNIVFVEESDDFDSLGLMEVNLFFDAFEFLSNANEFLYVNLQLVLTTAAIIAAIIAFHSQYYIPI